MIGKSKQKILKINRKPSNKTLIKIKYKGHQNNIKQSEHTIGSTQSEQISI